MAQSPLRKREDFLFELNPCPAFVSQRIKLWLDDFSGQFYPAQRSLYGKRMKKNYSIHYVLEGEGYFGVEDETPIKLCRGDAFYIKKNQLVSYFPSEEKPWKYCGISFDSSEVGGFFAGIGWESSCVLPHDRMTEQIGTLVRDTVAKKSEGRVGSYDVLGCACRIFSVLENRYVDHAPNTSPVSRYVSLAKEHIEASYSDPELRITHVAAAVNLSHPYLCRIFRQAEGCSPEQYLLMYRMRVARRLLGGGGYSVGEVAFLCGYTDAAQFSRMYKRCFGHAPSKS